jgi:hypothetical protein
MLVTSLTSFNGVSERERRLSRNAGFSTLCSSLFPDISLSMLMLLLRHREVSIVEQAEERRKISILPKKKKEKKVVFSNIIDHAMCICIS